MDTWNPITGTHDIYYNTYSFNNFKQKLFLLALCAKGYWKHPFYGCIGCPKRTYKDKEDTGVCTRCPRGQTAYTTHTKTADACYGKKVLFLNMFNFLRS